MPMSPMDPSVPGDLGPTFTPSLSGAPAFYVTGEDQLRLRSFNSVAGVTLALEGRMLRLDGSISPIAAPHLPATDRTQTTTLHAIGEGWLQHVSVRATAGAPRRGQCYVAVDLVRGQTNAVQPLGVITQGYVADMSPLAWPGMLPLASPDGVGVVLSVLGADPGAGAEWSVTVPTNARWRLFTAYVNFLTDATAANREVILTIDDGANLLFEATSTFNHTASLNVSYAFARNVQRGSSTTANLVNVPIPDMILMGGYRVRSQTVNMQGGDNFTAPRLCVEEWIED